MTLNLDKSNWKHVTLGEVIRHVTDRVDPQTSGLERFLAGEHIPSKNLEIREWGVIGQDPIGPMFYKRFQPGHVLYVSRRSYLRKTAVPRFTGICGEKTFVLETLNKSVLLQEFLPFILSAEKFHQYAIAMSRGSVNPYINWTDIAAYEFDLPPLDDQKRIADLLWAIEAQREAQAELFEKASEVSNAFFAAVAKQTPITSLSSWVTRIDAGRSPLAEGEPARDNEFGVLKVSAVGRNTFVSSENKRLLDESAFRPEDSVRSGDLLITRANAVIDNVARPCIVDRDYPNLMLSDKTLRLTPAMDHPKRVILAALQAPAYRAYVRGVVNGTEAKNITQQKILAGPVPDLRPETMHQLLNRLTASDAATNAVARELASLTALMSATLSDVFGDK